MILRIPARINGPIGGCWDWNSAPDLTAEEFSVQSSENAGRKRRRGPTESRKIPRQEDYGSQLDLGDESEQD
jgi:hypothetical protein